MNLPKFISPEELYKMCHEEKDGHVEDILKPEAIHALIKKYDLKKLIWHVDKQMWEAVN
jgi:hypothetical protein